MLVGQGVKGACKCKLILHSVAFACPQDTTSSGTHSGVGTDQHTATHVAADAAPVVVAAAHQQRGTQVVATSCT